ncbi:hypothetical protein ABH19_07250 [Leptospirillum sp. Group II 'CF-1']|jgi:glycosyltransferase involved in cell wall biosynthesis|nr:hypothetical protein ABH19_07250 [Leptospirillum sp. Group II 'CF-1']
MPDCGVWVFKSGGDRVNIFHLDCTTGFGGQESDHLSEARGFLEEGHRYILGTREGTPLDEKARKEVPTVSLPLSGNMDMVSLRRIRQVLLSEKIDVLVTTSYIDSWLGPLAAYSLGKSRPFVVRQRHLFNPPKNLFPYRKMCDRLVVVSDALRLYFMEKGLPFWHVTTIHRGIPEIDRRPSLEKDLSSPHPERPDGPIILQVGIFQRDKGQHLALDVFKKLVQKRHDLSLVFLGDGPLLPEVQARADQIFAPEIRRRIVFAGYQDPRPFLRRASVVIQPSLREALGLSILEALAEGLPVVAFRVGGVPEILNHAPPGRGILVQPWNTEAFASAVLESLEKTMPREPFDHKNVFSLKACVRKTLSFYEDGLEKLRSGFLHKNPYETIGGRADPMFRAKSNE